MPASSYSSLSIICGGRKTAAAIASQCITLLLQLQLWNCKMEAVLILGEMLIFRNGGFAEVWSL